MKHRVLPWLVALTLYSIRLTCRLKKYGDVRHELRAKGHSYIFATLHAHQIAAGMYGERGTGAMVSRSRDGGMIVPCLRLFGSIPIRGSGGRAGKGGATAMTQLIRHVNDGGAAVLAVDGPRGPRGHVHSGVALLAKKTGDPVFPLIAVPSRRWVIQKSWDRIQIPKPFARIDIRFSEPIWIGEDESLEDFAGRIERALRSLEQQHDPEQADPIETDEAETIRARAA